MGDRYFVRVDCPCCGFSEDDVYYAPTCGFLTLKCPECECLVDLEEYTGISYEEASNLAEMEALVEKIKEEYEDEDK